MLRLKEFYQQKRDLFKMNKSLCFKLSKKIKKSSKVFGRRKRASLRKKETQGILHITSSTNNTIVALTTLKGKVQVVLSTGSCGFQGKKKRSTKFAIETTLNSVLEAANDQKIKNIILCFKGYSRSRHSFLKSLKKQNLKVVGIRDLTPNPHNGCRPRKVRRG